MRILITFAVEAEFAPLRNRWWLQRFASSTTQYAGGAWYSSRVDAAEVEVVQTGIALRKCEPALSFRLQRPPDICICAGLAGALSPSLSRGEIVVARAARALVGGNTQTCDAQLVEIAMQTGARAADYFVTSDRVLVTAQEKANSSRLGDVVDMESLPVLRRVSEKGIRCVAIRAISDSAADELPIDFNRVTNEAGEISLRQMIFQLVQRPLSIPKMIEFGKHSAQAAGNLASFLDRYIGALRMQLPMEVADTARVALR